MPTATLILTVTLILTATLILTVTHRKVDEAIVESMMTTALQARAEAHSKRFMTHSVLQSNLPEGAGVKAHFQLLQEEL